MAFQIARNLSIPDGFYPQQREALVALYDWYRDKNPNNLEFRLRGFAGTGKTYILKYFVENIVNSTLCVTAPTHKALRVVENHIGRKGKTLQSLHGLRPNVDLASFSIENPQFDPLGVPQMQYYSIIIIDEASMINHSLFDLNRRKAKEYNTKILYVGDPFQLPPIGETMSKAFTHVHTGYDLTEIVRQEKGNPLLELFTLLRNDIANNKTTFIEHIRKNRTVIDDNYGYSLMNEHAYTSNASNYFHDPKFLDDIDYIRNTAFTNIAVTKWNKIIRNDLLNKPKDILIIHDILTSYNTILDEFNNPTIINSEDYIIKSIIDYVDDSGIKTFCVNLQSVFDGRVTTPFLIVDHTDRTSFIRYYKLLNYLHAQAYIYKKPNAWFNYYKVKNKLLTMESFRLHEINGSRLVKKDIDYGYTLTTHKLQGSTFKNINIDLKDILYPATDKGTTFKNEIAMANKLIYVALSRATNKAFLNF